MIKSEAWWKHDISAFSAKKITILDIAVVLELKWGGVGAPSKSKISCRLNYNRTKDFLNILTLMLEEITWISYNNANHTLTYASTMDKLIFLHILIPEEYGPSYSFYRAVSYFKFENAWEQWGEIKYRRTNMLTSRACQSTTTFEKGQHWSRIQIVLLKTHKQCDTFSTSIFRESKQLTLPLLQHPNHTTFYCIPIWKHAISHHRQNISFQPSHLPLVPISVYVCMKLRNLWLPYLGFRSHTICYQKTFFSGTTTYAQGDFWGRMRTTI